MDYKRHLHFDDFTAEVERRFSGEFGPDEYRAIVGKFAATHRKTIFGDLTKTQTSDLWPAWLKDASIPNTKDDSQKEISINNFNENTPKSLINCATNIFYAFAFHYRLHRVFSENDLKLAAELDRLVFQGKTFEEITGKIVFSFVRDSLVEAPAPLQAPMSYPPYVSESAAKSFLKSEPTNAIWLNPHNHYTIPLEGRESELSALTNFLESGHIFRILPVIGPSGAGKTRVVSQWMKQYAANWNPDSNWEAGFVISNANENARNPKPWRNWLPPKNTLIVIDYTYAFDEVVQAIFDRANEIISWSSQDSDRCSQQDSLRHYEQKNIKIRVILIDHTSPEFLWSKLQREHVASIANMKERFVESELVLGPEKEDGSQNLRHIIASAASVSSLSVGVKSLESIQIDHAASELDRIGREMGERDSVRHPLFAALMGEAIRKSSEDFVSFTNWSRRDLINTYFEGKDRLPWSGWDQIPDPLAKRRHKDGLYVGAIVSVATLRRGLLVADAKDHLPQKSESLFKQSCNIVASDSLHEVQEFLPDILGETFLLKFLSEVGHDSEVEHAFFDMLGDHGLGNAEEVASNFRETVQRLARNLANDSPTQPEIIKFWEKLPNLLVPQKFEKHSAIRLNVSFAISDVTLTISRIIQYLEQKEVETGLLARYQKIRAELKNRFELTELDYASQVDCNLNVAKATLSYFESFWEEGAHPPMKQILQILEKYQINNKEDWPPLLLGCSLGCNIFVRSLLKETSCNVNMVSDQGMTAAICASSNGHVAMLAFLKEKGADLNLPGNDSITPILAACGNGQVEALRYLHQQGLEIDGDKAARWASYNGHANILRYLYQQQISVSEFGNNQIFSILPASGMGHLEIVKFFYECGADLNLSTPDGVNAATTASFGGHLNVLQYLKSKDVNLNALRSDGLTTAMAACENGHISVVKFLKSQGVDLRAMKEDGTNALLIACQNGHLDLVKYLISEGLSLHSRTNNGWTAAMLACENDHLRMLKYLHSKEVNLSAQSNDGDTVYSIAKKTGSEKILEFLQTTIPT